MGGSVDFTAGTVDANIDNLKVGAGGTFATGGFSDTLGTLTLAANSILDPGSGASVLHFASSNDTTDEITWSGSLLMVNNWSGTAGTGGGADEIFVGSSTTNLTLTARRERTSSIRGASELPEHMDQFRRVSHELPAPPKRDQSPLPLLAVGS